MENPDLLLVQGYPQTAENSLQDHGEDGQNTEPPEPAALFLAPQPDRQNYREQSHTGSDESMGMLVENASDPLADWKEEHVVPVARRPVGHRHSSSVTRHQAANPNEGQRGPGGDRRKAGKPGIIG